MEHFISLVKKGTPHPRQKPPWRLTSSASCVEPTSPSLFLDWHLGLSVYPPLSFSLLTRDCFKWFNLTEWKPLRDSESVWSIFVGSMWQWEALSKSLRKEQTNICPTFTWLLYYSATSVPLKSMMLDRWFLGMNFGAGARGWGHQREEGIELLLWSSLKLRLGSHARKEQGITSVQAHGTIIF